MMTRRPTVAVAVMAVAALGVAPSLAAPKKPAPIKGSYTLRLVPDYTINQMQDCGVIPLAQNKHPLGIPAKGTLVVKLAGGDHPGAGLADWDMYTLDAGGDVLSAAENPGVNEVTVDKFKAKTSVTIWVCNLAGTPDGKVSYTFTYT